jgi:hypothetical protein
VVTAVNARAILANPQEVKKMKPRQGLVETTEFALE